MFAWAPHIDAAVGKGGKTSLVYLLPNLAQLSPGQVRGLLQESAFGIPLRISAFLLSLFPPLSSSVFLARSAEFVLLSFLLQDGPVLLRPSVVRALMTSRPILGTSPHWHRAR